MYDYSTVAEAGAQLFDKVDPTWHEKVDTDLLNMGSDKYDVCGQVLGRPYHQCLGKLGITHAQTTRYGIYVDGGRGSDQPARYRALTRAWKAAIDHRRRHALAA